MRARYPCIIQETQSSVTTQARVPRVTVDYFFCITLDTSPTTPLSLELSDAKIYESRYELPSGGGGGEPVDVKQKSLIQNAPAGVYRGFDGQGPREGASALRPLRRSRVHSTRVPLGLLNTTSGCDCVTSLRLCLEGTCPKRLPLTRVYTKGLLTPPWYKSGGAQGAYCAAN